MDKTKIQESRTVKSEDVIDISNGAITNCLATQTPNDAEQQPNSDVKSEKVTIFVLFLIIVTVRCTLTVRILIIKTLFYKILLLLL